MTTRSPAHFREAWRHFRTSWRVLVSSMLVLFASWVGLEVAVVVLQPWGIVLNVVLHVGFLFLFSGLMVGIHRIALRVVDGETPALSEVTGLLERGPSFLLAVSLYSIIVIGGLLLLVVPGVYVAVRYALFGHVLATRNASAVDALREAAAVSRSHWWSVFHVMLLALAFNVAGAAVLGLGLLASYPVSLLASASVFRTIQDRGSHAAQRTRVREYG